MKISILCGDISRSLVQTVVCYTRQSLVYNSLSYLFPSYRKKINRLLQLHDKKGIFARGIKTIMKSFSHSHWSEKLTVIRMLFYKKAKKGM